MCGGGPKGQSAEELLKQQEAAKATAQAETAKLEAERQLEKDKENARQNAQSAQMAEADKAKRERQQTLMQGILTSDEEDEDKVKLPDGTPADILDEEKPKRKKKALNLLSM